MKEVGCTSACEPAACLLSLCLWGKTKVLHDEEGRRVNSTAAWRNAAGEPGRGRGPLGALRTHGSQQTHKQKLASQKTATHTHIHKTLSHVSIPISSYTHTLPSLAPASSLVQILRWRCQTAAWTAWCSHPRRRQEVEMRRGMTCRYGSPKWFALGKSEDSRYSFTFCSILLSCWELGKRTDSSLVSVH